MQVFALVFHYKEIDYCKYFLLYSFNILSYLFYGKRVSAAHTDHGLVIITWQRIKETWGMKYFLSICQRYLYTSSSVFVPHTSAISPPSTKRQTHNVFVHKMCIRHQQHAHLLQDNSQRRLLHNVNNIFIITWMLGTWLCILPSEVFDEISKGQSLLGILVHSSPHLPFYFLLYF